MVEPANSGGLYCWKNHLAPPVDSRGVVMFVAAAGTVAAGVAGVTEHPLRWSIVGEIIASFRIKLRAYFCFHQRFVGSSVLVYHMLSTGNGPPSWAIFLSSASALVFLGFGFCESEQSRIPF